MFDIGFVELLLVAAMGLLVLGPDKLPTAIRTGIVWWKRLRNSLESAREQVQEEINHSEMQSHLGSYQDSAQQLGDELRSIEDIDLLNQKHGKKVALRHKQDATSKKGIADKQSKLPADAQERTKTQTTSKRKSVLTANSKSQTTLASTARSSSNKTRVKKTSGKVTAKTQQ